MRRNIIHTIVGVALLAGIPVVSGCSLTTDKDTTYPEYNSREWYRERQESLKGGDETLFGELSIGGDSKKSAEAGQGPASVNYYLWRATLETLALGPLESADPFGGVVMTDWFSLDEEPGSEYRLQAFILGRELRTDNIKVHLFVKRANQGRVVQKRGSAEAETKLEDVILAKARDIRASQFR